MPTRRTRGLTRGLSVFTRLAGAWFVATLLFWLMLNTRDCWGVSAICRPTLLDVVRWQVDAIMAVIAWFNTLRLW